MKMMSKHEKIPRRKRKSFYTNSYSKIRVKEDLIADKLQVSYWGSYIGCPRGSFSDIIRIPTVKFKIPGKAGYRISVTFKL